MHVHTHVTSSLYTHLCKQTDLAPLWSCRVSSITIPVLPGLLGLPCYFAGQDNFRVDGVGQRTVLLATMCDGALASLITSRQGQCKRCGYYGMAADGHVGSGNLLYCMLSAAQFPTQYLQVVVLEAMRGKDSRSMCSRQQRRSQRLSYRCPLVDLVAGAHVSLAGAKQTRCDAMMLYLIEHLGKDQDPGTEIRSTLH